MNKNFSIVILLFGSAFYLSGITQFSPVYFSLIYGFIALMSLGKICLNAPSLFLVIISIYVVVVQAILFSTGFRAFIYFSGHLFLFAVSSFIFKESKDYIINGVKKSLFLLILLLFVEFIYRVGFNQIINSLNVFFDFNQRYFDPFKVGSFMFMDSNHVAMVILPFFFLTIYLRKFHNQKNTFLLLVLLFVLTLFTFSRSVILVQLIFGLLFLQFRIERYFKLFGLLFTLTLVLFGPYFYEILSSDASFLSKVDLLVLISRFFEISDLKTIFFGVGYGKSSEILGLGTHTLFLTYLVEGGVILLILILISYYLIYLHEKKTIYILIPWVIAGFSFAPQSQSFLYSSLGIIFLLERK